MIKALFQAVRRDHLDVTLRSGPDLSVRIVERPALWMTPDALAVLQGQLRTVAAQVLPQGDLTYGVFAQNGKRLRDTIITHVSTADGVPIAFNALAVMHVDIAPEPVEVLHLGLVMVDPAFQQKNLSWVLYGLTCFLIFMRRQMRPIWVSNVTQVPAVVGMVDAMFTGVWPAPQAGPRKLDHLMIARAIMTDHRAVFGVGDEAGFDDQSFVISNAYGGGSEALQKTWEAAPKYRDEAYNVFCADALDYDRGDDVLQLGQMDMTAMRTYLRRSVPRSAVLGLIVAGVLVALRRVILPVIYWADAGKSWRGLRPWTGAK